MQSLKELANFELPVTTLGTINLAQRSNKNIIIYFYPKDSTPGCTIESKDLRDHYADFQALNTDIFGVSRDSLQSHDKFKAKHQLPFELIADEQQQLCNSFDVIKEKSMFGKKYRGIERSTFLFNGQGQLVNEWRKVKIKGHGRRYYRLSKHYLKFQQFPANKDASHRHSRRWFT